MRGAFFVCVFYIIYRLVDSTANKIGTNTGSYNDKNRGVIIKPIVQINGTDGGVISIVGREAMVVDDDVMSFSEIEIVSSTFVGTAKEGYINSKTNEIVMLARPKFKIYRP
jgi:hypothetical protein